ncbi:hypothetical protein [Halobacillus seohaensis]|uniref:Uncharacterized protein n=1 Tax=Halobacillus seohaensis TaxID=447421 RepID=A0ABW2ERA9_9BACI
MGVFKKLMEAERKYQAKISEWDDKAKKKGDEAKVKQADAKPESPGKPARKRWRDETSNERWLGIGKMFAGATIFYYAAVPMAVLFVILLFIGVGLWDFIVGLF